MQRFILIVLCLLCAVPALGQSDGSGAIRLTLDDVIRLTRAGIPDDVIATRIKRNGKPFDLTTEEILELRKMGVSDAVIKMLMDPTLPYTPPPVPTGKTEAAPSPQRTPEKSIDPLGAKVPSESGMYYLEQPEKGEFRRLSFKPLTASKSGSKLTSILTAGLKKSATTAYLAGSSANTQVKKARPVFYARLPENAKIEDILLLSLDKTDESREVDLGPDPEKPVFPIEKQRQFESVHAGQSLVRITTEPLTNGEYLFLLLGTGEPKKGIVGKGWEFSLALPGK